MGNCITAKREPIEYADASAEVRAVYDDIVATRRTDWINNFWQYSELLAIVGLANETSRLITALDVAIDPSFL